jgi:hypothetical protein
MGHNSSRGRGDHLLADKRCIACEILFAMGLRLKVERV